MTLFRRRRSTAVDGGDEWRPPRAVPWAMAATGVVVLVYLLSTVFRSKHASSMLFDGVIGNIGYTGCGVLCAWRAVRERKQRRAWATLSLALFLFTAGAVLWTTTVQYWHPVPYPSISDAFFLVFYPVAYLGVGLLIRETAPRGSRGVWFDGMIAALGVAALEAVFVIARISHANEGNLPTVATNLAYPIGDLVLVVMIVGFFAVRGWRPERFWWTLAAGLVLFAFADTVYVLRVTAGTYQTGTPLDSLWLLGTFLVAVAAWQSPSSRTRIERDRQPVLIPAVFLLSSLAIVVANGVFVHLLAFGVVLATATLLVAIARMAHSYRQLSTLADTRREALTDELTGLGNRRMLTRRLDEWLHTDQLSDGAEPDRLAVLLVDLDRFKEVNDAFGHRVGDELLARLGPRLRDVLRTEDVLTRLGGDEFAVVLHGADSDHALVVARRVVAALNLPFGLDEVTVHTGASIGIALSPEHAIDSTELLRCADVAMYRAKNRHSTVEVYEPRTDTNLGRFQLVHDLREAIAARELMLHFQPQMDLHTRRIRSVEALVRWQHPTRGWVPPDEFIPLAEECRLMRPLLRLVLDVALSQCAAWRRSGADITVAVNLSATNVLDADLTYDIARKLELHGVPASALRLEITEGVLLVDPVRAGTVLAGLREAGLSISIDDFGTGFSSLAYLRELPVDELKVDRAFISHLAHGESARDTAIAHSALTLGHALGMSVVAEGVENAATLAILRELGFDGAQGYHLGRPVAADDLDLRTARVTATPKLT